MWTGLLDRLGLRPGSRAAKEAAGRAFAAAYPALEPTDVWLRARESARDVVAVLYRERGDGPSRKGSPTYKVFAVTRALVASELPPEKCEPYRIRGIK